MQPTEKRKRLLREMVDILLCETENGISSFLDAERHFLLLPSSLFISLLQLHDPIPLPTEMTMAVATRAIKTEKYVISMHGQTP